MAAPFHNQYAFLGDEATARKTDYLHNQPVKMQEEHRRTMASIWLAVIALESTIDKLDRLRFRHMHCASLNELEKTPLPLQPTVFANEYTRTPSCPTPFPDH